MSVTHHLKIKPNLYKNIIECQEELEIIHVNKGFKEGDTITLMPFGSAFGTPIPFHLKSITDYREKKGCVVLGIERKQECIETKTY
ncbi:DUF3850 domain-containing protein [Bacillus sp. FSL M8-0256]|uniref:DUF3850 domain-containing protein n=1 Tax=Bacillus sp. FSL M8-0256 TaxID=2954578 RepID=UPI0030F5DE3D